MLDPFLGSGDAIIDKSPSPLLRDRQQSNSILYNIMGNAEDREETAQVGMRKCHCGWGVCVLCTLPYTE